MIAAIGGGAVVKWYGPTPGLFALYAIGLLVVFAILSIYVGLVANPSDKRGGRLACGGHCFQQA